MVIPMFRFAIRDVLWLTLAAGLACAWWIDRSRLTAHNRATAGGPMWDWERDATSYQRDAAVAEARLEVMARKMREHGWMVNSIGKSYSWVKIQSNCLLRISKRAALGVL